MRKVLMVAATFIFVIWLQYVLGFFPGHCGIDINKIICSSAAQKTSGNPGMRRSTHLRRKQAVKTSVLSTNCDLSQYSDLPSLFFRLAKNTKALEPLYYYFAKSSKSPPLVC